MFVDLNISKKNMSVCTTAKPLLLQLGSYIVNKCDMVFTSYNQFQRPLV